MKNIYWRTFYYRNIIFFRSVFYLFRYQVGESKRSKKKKPFKQISLVIMLDKSNWKTFPHRDEIYRWYYRAFWWERYISDIIVFEWVLGRYKWTISQKFEDPNWMSFENDGCEDSILWNVLIYFRLDGGQILPLSVFSLNRNFFSTRIWEIYINIWSMDSPHLKKNWEERKTSIWHILNVNKP